jgi:predicted HAD superfamily Cof-like phosphohydrolase
MTTFEQRFRDLLEGPNSLRGINEETRKALLMLCNEVSSRLTRQEESVLDSIETMQAQLDQLVRRLGSWEQAIKEKATNERLDQLIARLKTEHILPIKTSSDWSQDVADFMAKFDQPRCLDSDVDFEHQTKRRLAWLDEEITELKMAAAVKSVEGVADGIVDSIYVLIGMALEWGIDIRPVWDEVHAANMRKEKDPAGGKVRKPAYWVGPNIHAALIKGWKG